MKELVNKVSLYCVIAMAATAGLGLLGAISFIIYHAM